MERTALQRRLAMTMPRGSVVTLAIVTFFFTVAALGFAATVDSNQTEPVELRMPDSLRVRHEAFHVRSEERRVGKECA